MVSKHTQGGRAEPIGRGGNAVISLVVGDGRVFQVGCNCLSLAVPFYLPLNKNPHPPPKPVSGEDNVDPICFVLRCSHQEPGGSSWGLLSYRNGTLYGFGSTVGSNYFHYYGCMRFALLSCLFMQYSSCLKLLDHLKASICENARRSWNHTYIKNHLYMNT